VINYQQQQHAASLRGEKEKGIDKQESDDYYDDRLTRDSQLDSHLKELRSGGVDCGEFGGISAGLFSANEDEDSVRVDDEFYEETDENDDQPDQPAETCIVGEIISSAEMEEMLGGWGAGDIPSPPQANPAKLSTLPGQNASTVSSELLIDIPPRYVTRPQESVSSRDSTPNADKQNQAEMAYVKEQLVVAFSQIAVLEEMVAGQAEAAHTAVKTADSVARDADSMATKSGLTWLARHYRSTDTQNQQGLLKQV
jgi:hypothetical protein